ncbi:putative carboxylesterase 2 [Apostasia shenzhenica]|uniref:Putative carboxylesterase 2 n=1 Tax=Apostasia shenzhenica TaxID=1088818 RepID=A0A2I0AVE0_9ASPA|nr:putative carboxylesterase 2 [Apostasia shenzhenica]
MKKRSTQLHPPPRTSSSSSSSMEIAAAAPDKINFEILPFLRTYRSGRIERFLPAKPVPPSVDPRTGVSSADITINPNTRLSARLYLPPSAVISRRPARKLPVIVYYHGGGFCTFSASSLPYHSYLNSLVAEADVVAVSVDYRLAPEHPLPAAYDDSWEALLWVAEHAYGVASAGGIDWRLAEAGDFSRIFLAGDSAGANIVHNVGVKLGEWGMEVEGMAMVHPFFWGKERMVSEGWSTAKDNKKTMFNARDFDSLWPFVCPGTNGLDDPRVNPMAVGAPGLAALGCRRVLVSTAERDLLRERGRAYYERLRASGWGREAELCEIKGKDHVFHIFERPCREAAELLRRLAGFFNEESMKGRYSLLMGCAGIQRKDTSRIGRNV